MNIKKNVLYMCLVSTLGTTSSTAHALELINVPEPVAAPALSDSTPTSTPPEHQALDPRQLSTESKEIVRSPSDSVKPLKTPPIPQAHVHHIGERVASATESFGDNIPFTVALSMIVPSGWGVHVTESVKAFDMPVSWAKHADWLDVVQSVANRHPLRPTVRINWDKQSVFVTDKAYSPDGTSNWHVRSGRTLRTVLEDWAAIEGWTVVWDLKHDFLLGADARYRGNLAGAIEQLVQSTARANRILNIEMWSHNQVIHVAERKGARL